MQTQAWRVTLRLSKPLLLKPYTLRTVYQMEGAGIKVSTIEPWDGTAQFGSSKHHMVAPIGSLGDHVPPGRYDVIIINGVIGEFLRFQTNPPQFRDCALCCPYASLLLPSG
jgi:hypothetical protein